MSELLHVHHDDDLHEMSDMQAVCRRVKTDVELDLFVLQQLADLVLIRGLLDKASFFEHIVSIVKMAHAVRYKIKFHSISSRDLLPRVLLFFTYRAI